MKTGRHSPDRHAPKSSSAEGGMTVNDLLKAKLPVKVTGTKKIAMGLFNKPTGYFASATFNKESTTIDLTGKDFNIISINKVYAGFNEKNKQDTHKYILETDVKFKGDVKKLSFNFTKPITQQNLGIMVDDRNLLEEYGIKTSATEEKKPDDTKKNAEDLANTMTGGIFGKIQAAGKWAMWLSFLGLAGGLVVAHRKKSGVLGYLGFAVLGGFIGTITGIFVSQFVKPQLAGGETGGSGKTTPTAGADVETLWKNIVDSQKYADNPDKSMVDEDHHKKFVDAFNSLTDDEKKIATVYLNRVIDIAKSTADIEDKDQRVATQFDKMEKSAQDLAKKFGEERVRDTIQKISMMS